MELKQLEYFRHVAELGSFTRAAAFLSVVQPALSRQVRQLEIELGQSLFERNGRGVVLTDAGTRLLEHTRGILMQIGRARQELEDQTQWRLRAFGARPAAESRPQRHRAIGKGLWPASCRMPAWPRSKACPLTCSNGWTSAELIARWCTTPPPRRRSTCSLFWTSSCFSWARLRPRRAGARPPGPQVHCARGIGGLSADHSEPPAFHAHVGRKCAGCRRSQNPRGPRNRMHSRHHRFGSPRAWLRACCRSMP